MPGLRLGHRPAPARAAGLASRSATRPAGARLHRPGPGRLLAPAAPRAALDNLPGAVTLVPRSGIQQVLNAGRVIGHAEQAGQPVGDAPENGVRLLVIFLALYDDETHLRTRIVRSDPKLDPVRGVARVCQKLCRDVVIPPFMDIM